MPTKTVKEENPIINMSEDNQSTGDQIKNNSNKARSKSQEKSENKKVPCYGHQRTTHWRTLAKQSVLKELVLPSSFGKSNYKLKKCYNYG
ncbi:hypothetical protein evm_009876 [Chilo suppressalis]|nr:hypothetical protein evm_009876 [Chilo suppressalis]